MVTCPNHSFNDLWRELDRRGLWPKQEKKEKTFKPKEISKIYQYIDLDGLVRHETVRYVPKQFMQRRPDPNNPGGYIWSLEGCETILYRLRSVVDAVASNATICLVEGEKDADNIVERLGLVATTNPMGAKKWKQSYTDTLKGGRILLFADNDETGMMHVYNVAKLLTAAGCKVRIVLLPGLALKGDVTDWLDSGGTKEQLIELVKAAPLYDPNAVKAQPVEVEKTAAKPVLKRDELTDSDLANARRLVFHHGRELRHVDARGYMAYSNDLGVWRPNEKEAHRRAKDISRRLLAELASASMEERDYLFRHTKRTQQNAGIRAMLDIAKSEPEFECSLSDFDRDDEIINCSNGVINLRTGERFDHSPDFMCTKIIRAEYHPIPADEMNERPKTWLRFLHETYNGDEEMIAYVRRWFGYFLTGMTNGQCFPFLGGRGRNGKSTIAYVAKRLLSAPDRIGRECDYVCTLSKDSLMKDKQPQIRQDLAKLVNMRLVIGSELTEGERIDEALIKTMTGQDPIVARFMRENEFEFIPKFKVLLYGNFKPVIRDDSDGTWRRIHYWNHRAQVDEKKMDRDLWPKLDAEINDIFYWAVLGAVELIDMGVGDGLARTEQVEKDTAAYRRESDEMEQFLGQCCAVDTDENRAAKNYRFRSAIDDLYRYYIGFCEKRRMPVKGLPRFSELLRNKGFESEENAFRIVEFLGIKPIQAAPYQQTTIYRHEPD